MYKKYLPFIAFCLFVYITNLEFGIGLDENDLINDHLNHLPESSYNDGNYNSMVLTSVSATANNVYTQSFKEY